MKKLIFLLLSTAFVPGMYAQDVIKKMDDNTWGAIDANIAANFQQYNLKGLSVAVVYGGNIAFAKGYGNKNDNGDPFTIYTKSLLASVSKTITGVLAMRLVENGDINLNDALSQYFSDYSGSGISIRHLMAHQSGISHYSDCPGGYSGPFNAQDSYDVVVDCEICMTPPGSGSLYTTFGNTLLGVLISNVGFANYGLGYTGLYDTWMHDPGNLGTLEPAYDSSDPDLAEGENDDSWDDIGWKLPAGGFKSNIIDLADYARGLLNNTFITDATFQDMMVDQAESGNPTYDCGSSMSNLFGLTFDVSSNNPSDIDFFVWHNGLNDHGYSSYFAVYPNRNAAVVMLTNTDDATGALAEIHNDIAQYIRCPVFRNFTNEIDWTEPRIFEASTFILGSAEISSTYDYYIFDADSYVRLTPGFHAGPGVKFLGVVEGCEGNIIPD
jgi:CubicO group peptidase (beta-lactamase class C family)